MRLLPQLPAILIVFVLFLLIKFYYYLKKYYQINDDSVANRRFVLSRGASYLEKGGLD
jgi:uncharacterized membrane protein YdbT with pleckstrin-like domain